MGAPVDEATLARLAQDLGGEEVVAEIVDTFLADAARIQATLEGADGADERGVARALHTLKSSAAVVGALHLSELCRQAEDAARRGDAEGAKARVPGVLDELGRVVPALKARRRA
jgi:HPt (histidine-containing phosphotransfer) domain-containing protein